MAKYTEKDAARDTDSSVKEVKEAWHEAREIVSQHGEIPERGPNKLAKELGIKDGQKQKERLKSKGVVTATPYF